MAQKVCSACGLKPSKCKGRCDNCYRRWKKRTDPDFVTRNTANARAYAARNRTRIAAYRHEYGKAYYLRNPRHRGKRYHLTPEQVQALCSQGCQLCGRTANPRIDHDHVTGQVRGCLCPRCNTLLAALELGPSWLKKAKAYLKNPPGVPDA